MIRVESSKEAIPLGFSSTYGIVHAGLSEFRMFVARKKKSV